MKVSDRQTARPRAVAALLSLLLVLCAGPQLAVGDEGAEVIWSQIQSLEQLQDLWVQQEMSAGSLPMFDLGPYGKELAELKGRLEALAKRGDTNARYYQGALHALQRLKLSENASKDGEYKAARLEFEEAISWWRPPLADEGDAQSEWQLGSLYAEGHGVTKSPLNPIEWYYKTAQSFRRNGNRERALTVLDAMRELDLALASIVRCGADTPNRSFRKLHWYTSVTAEPSSASPVTNAIAGLFATMAVIA